MPKSVKKKASVKRAAPKPRASAPAKPAAPKEPPYEGWEPLDADARARLSEAAK